MITTAMTEFFQLLSKGKLRVVDLTQVVNERAPDFSGGKGSFHYQVLSSMESDGCFTDSFSINAHFGTHIDAPAHFSPDDLTMDKVPPKQLILPAVVIDVRKEVEKNADYQLTVQKIQEFEQHGEIAQNSAVLLLTGWDRHYSDTARYRNVDAGNIMHFPGFSLDAARYLVSERKVNALGIDTLSVDPGISQDYSVHNMALPAHAIMIENLTRLDQLSARDILLFCGPLLIEGGSGSPARVLAITP